MSVFEHFTRRKNISKIEQEGLSSKLQERENAVAGDYSHPTIYFSIGCKGALETVDLWIRYEYDQLTMTENMPHGSKGINKELLQRTYDKIYEDFKNRKYLVLDLKEGESSETVDFSLKAIDFKKENDINRGIAEMEKWFYGPYTDLTSPTMEPYNMSIHEGIDIAPDKITLITDNDGKDDALSILIKMYDRYNIQDIGVHDLDKFVNYAKLRIRSEMVQEGKKRADREEKSDSKRETETKSENEPRGRFSKYGRYEESI